MKTETQAKDCSCPFDRKFCAASKCMAWRWADLANERGFCGMVVRPEEIKEAGSQGAARPPAFVPLSQRPRTLVKAD